MTLTASLLPKTAGVGDNGLHIGGCDLTELANEYGTPLVVYDEDHLRSRSREAMSAFPDGVSYASKAFLCAAIARLVHEEGLHLDVASGGELEVALAAGIPGAALVMHGNNKSSHELSLALENSVGRIVIDSEDEIRRIQDLVDLRHTAPPRVFVRINPSVDSATHSFVSTGHAESKFGFRIDTGHALRSLDQLQRDPQFDVVGVHVHVGSQLLDLTSIGQGVARAAATALAAGLGELSVGGGLGVAYTEAETAPTFRDWSDVVHLAAQSAGFAGRILAEPGRSLVATAGVTLYRVGTIKTVGTDRTYLSVDGGISDNPRPALYGSAYEAFLPRLPYPDAGAGLREVTVVGKNCESGDTLVHGAKLADDVAVGDVLCLPVTGAYVHAMSSNYNKLPRPAVVFVKNANARLVIRRETAADMMRTDCLLDRAAEPCLV
jgi:diaminopimelate decarboxylase